MVNFNKTQSEQIHLRTEVATLKISAKMVASPFSFETNTSEFPSIYVSEK